MATENTLASRHTIAISISILASLVASISGWADTEVGGTISEDTIWGPNSPTMPDTVYIVVSDVDVVSGVQLTVEPGVTVKFNEGLSLSVHGSLVAGGGESEEDRSYFTSNQPDPVPGDWKELHASAAGRMGLANCVIEYGGGAGNGLLTGWNADVIHVADTRIRYSSSHGIKHTYSGASPENVSVESCEIEDNGYTGIRLIFNAGSVCSPVISDCRVRRSASLGIEISFFNSSSGSPQISGCEVTDSGPSGATGYGGEAIHIVYEGASTGSPVIVGCTLAYNGNEGVSCAHLGGSSGDVTVSECDMLYNEEDGVEIGYAGVGSSGTFRITACHVEWNTETGIEAGGRENATVHVVIDNCTVLNTRPGDPGGSGLGIWLGPGGGGSITVRDCVVGSTWGSEPGYEISTGYFADSWGSILVSGCTILGGDGTSGLHLRNYGVSPGQVLVDRCLFLGTDVDGIKASGPLDLTVANTLCAGCANGIRLNGLNAALNCCTFVSNTGDGAELTNCQAQISNSIFAYNGSYGVQSTDASTPEVRYCDFWENGSGAMSGEFPGGENLYLDPEFADHEAGDCHLTCGSPCVDAGDPDTPPVDGTRIDMGAFQFGGVTVAPDPQAYGDVALFGEPMGGYPGWVWFSVPFYPCGPAEPSDVLGFDCAGNVFCWDRYGKFSQAYQPPFLTWDLVPANSYLLWLEGPVDNPSYLGEDPQKPCQFRLGRMGWAWLGMPANVMIPGDDFMSFVQVKYPSDETGEVRTAQEDYDATPGNWIAWSWAFFDTGTQSPKTFTPYAPFGNTDCHPWLGYRVWVSIGTAANEGDPDQATLIWP